MRALVTGSPDNSLVRELSVIYAEDEPLTRAMFAHMAKTRFEHVRVAADGAEALAMFHERPCDLLITDLNMPNMNGLELCRRARELVPELPIIVISANDDAGMMLESINIGVNGYLLKPLDRGSFDSVVSRAAAGLLARRQLQQAARVWSQSFDAVPDMIAVLDTDYRVISINSTALEMLEKSAEQVLGEDYCSLLHADGRKPEHCAANQLLEDGKWHSCYEPVPMFGKHFHVTISPLNDDQGRLTGAVHVARDISQQVATEMSLRYVSTHDQLTGLYNRCWFEAELARLERGRIWPISIVIADMDGLKRINDHQGHGAGDSILREAALLLQGCCRSDEMIARIGGDEFVILLPGIDEDGAATVVRRINDLQDQLKKTCIHPVSLSLGHATALAETGLKSALATADSRMYANKDARCGTTGRVARQRNPIVYRCGYESVQTAADNAQ